MRFRDSTKGGDTNAGSFRLCPAHCQMPTISKGDWIIIMAADLVDIFKKEQPESVRERRKHVHKYIETINWHIGKTFYTTAARPEGGQCTLNIR